MFEKFIRFLYQTGTHKIVYNPEAESLSKLISDLSEDRMVEKFLHQCILAITNEYHIKLELDVSYYNYLRISPYSKATISFMCNIDTSNIIKAECSYGIEKSWEITSYFTAFKLTDEFLEDINQCIRDKCGKQVTLCNCTRDDDPDGIVRRELKFSLGKDDDLYRDIFDVARSHIYEEIRRCKRSKIYRTQKEEAEKLFCNNFLYDLIYLKNYLSTTKVYYDKLQICFYSSTESNEIIRVEGAILLKGNIKENIVIGNSKNIKVVLTYGFVEAIQERISKKRNICFSGELLDNNDNWRYKQDFVDNHIPSQEDEILKLCISLKLD